MMHRYLKLSGYAAVACILFGMTATPGLDAKAQSAAAESTEQSSGTDSSQSEISGKNYLLYGYNSLQGGYINTTNTGFKPILGKCQETVDDPTSASYDHISYTHSTSIRDFYEQFSGAFDGSYSGIAFSGNVKSEFSTTRDISQNREFMRYTSYFYDKDISNDTAVSDLSEYLSPNFVKDVKSLYKSNPAEIFSIYGTHLIMQYYTGGRLDINFSYTNTDAHSESEIQASVAATYARVSSSATADDINKSQLVDQHSNLTSESVGGPTTYHVSARTVDSMAQQFSQWQSHLDENPDICGIKTGALKGIWDLFPNDPDISKALYKEYQNELTAKENGLDDMDGGPITDITVLVGSSHDEAAAKLPAGYYIALTLDPGSDNKNMDANHRGGGPYIYVAYTYQPVTDVHHHKLNPIVDFFVKEGKNTEIQGYGKIPIDLNKGQHGSPCIYLFFRRATQGEYNSSKTLYISRLAGYYYTDYVLPANWYAPSNSLQLNDGAKPHVGHDDFVNLAFQNTYRDMNAALTVDEGKEPVVAASELLTADTDDDKEDTAQDTDVSSGTTTTKNPTTENSKPENPKTGADTNPLESMSIICLLSASALLLSKKMMRRRNQLQ